MYETVNVIDAEYTEMALELAGMGVSTEDIFKRVEASKKCKAELAESKAYRNNLRVTKNNRIGKKYY